MPRQTPRVGVPTFGPSDLPEGVRAAGAEPVPLRLPDAPPRGGVALAREWTADATQILCADAAPDALLLDAGTPEELFGMLLAAVRLGLPAVCAPPPGTPLTAALTALGVAPATEDARDVARELAAGDGPRPAALLDNFSLANALRAGVAAGGGPELIVHLSALAREAGVAGFSQMAHVLAPETAVFSPTWTAEHGVGGLLASLGDALHDVPTVSERLKNGLPDAPRSPEGDRRWVFLRARASGAEALCGASAGVSEVAGTCRVFASEDAAVRAVRVGEIGEKDWLVVGGCGPRGGTGLLRLDVLGDALRETGLRAAVITDGLAPQDAPGVWASLFAPEAAVGGVIRRLRDGDGLRMDLEGGRIRAGIGAKELESRTVTADRALPGAGYAARYARSALPALEGAGFP